MLTHCLCGTCTEHWPAVGAANFAEERASRADGGDKPLVKDWTPLLHQLPPTGATHPKSMAPSESLTLAISEGRWIEDPC